MLRARDQVGQDPSGDESVRLDAVRATFPKKTSRAALVRAFTLAMLAAFPEAPLPERCAP